MDRRNFFKIVSTVSAGAASIACHKDKTAELIPLLVPDHQLIQGEEQWRPSTCSGCAAGCGVILRVMEGERIVERQGAKFRESIACIKKVEGNPLDSVSGGRLCARGHAALQSLYHPDRVKGPLRRTGARGKAEFTAVSWDAAIAEVADKLGLARTAHPERIVFLTPPRASARNLAIQAFQSSLNARPPAYCTSGHLALEHKAAELVFGAAGIPHYDLGAARYALGVGADFLGGWASPVFYGRQYGHFRQGRPGLRGKFVQADSRLSLTAASADEWLPIAPGTELQFLIAVARLLLDEKLTRASAAQDDAIRAADLSSLIKATGLPEKRLRRVVRELGESEAPLVIAGASALHTNSLEALLAAHYVNQLLDNVGKPGGVWAPVPAAAGVPLPVDVQTLRQAEVLLLDGENPLYSYPSASFSAASLERVGLIVSFGQFIDDSAAYADFILPDHHEFESESAVAAAVAATRIAVAVSAPAARPLYGTRALDRTLAALAGKMNVAYAPPTARAFSAKEGTNWDDILRQGGLWMDAAAVEEPKPNLAGTTLSWHEAQFSGAPEQFPFHFQPYLSLQYHDGADANLPWMRELPDPTSSVMWSLPVEIDPHAAAKLGLRNGDWLRVTSPHGSLEAQAYVHPAAIPGVVSMAIGDGHASYGRYASRTGANPLAILAPVWEQSTGALAFGATRVRLSRLDRPAELTQFAPSDREQAPWGKR